jgi:hypothetical protein
MKIENYERIKLVQLSDYVWLKEVREITGKKEKRSKECTAKRIKLGKGSFLHKSCVDPEIVKQCTDLKNLYPLGAFLDLVGIDWKFYLRKMQSVGKSFDIYMQLEEKLMMIKLPDELFEKYDAIKNKDTGGYDAIKNKDTGGLEPELYYLIDENYLEDETVIVEKNIKIGIY